MVCTIKKAARSSKNDEDMMFVAIIPQWNVGRTWNRLAVKLHSGNTAGDAAGIFHTNFVASRMVSKINGIVWPGARNAGINTEDCSPHPKPEYPF